MGKWRKWHVEESKKKSLLLTDFDQDDIMSTIYYSLSFVDGLQNAVVPSAIEKSTEKPSSQYKDPSKVLLITSMSTWSKEAM